MGEARTNLDRVLKSRDIALLTKVCIVRAVVFPVVTHSCESWTVERQNTKQLMPLTGESDLVLCGVMELRLPLELFTG